MSPAVIMERVYEALKYQLMHGALAPGARLDPVRLAADLNASATPVRDALHRLVGERMVRYFPQDGFHAPIPSEFGLRDLYRWHQDLVASAMRQGRDKRIDEAALALEANAPDAHRQADTTMQLFAAIAALSDNLELRHAIIGCNERLHISRLAEAEALGGSFSDLLEIAHFLAKGAQREALSALTSYHRRRMRAVPRITVMIRTMAGADA
ncbi:GntR family transcriptional regulator [Sphingomonas sp. LaA6.9]|uniref:GntR family transcriptional regulator n=1 Tax=Sphingomonas sp. LaA6.9 TaxID=2919914 RepID=UPI00247A00F8|nr:GntR family transcriptional regulator [Sphingomonas sp. LaA6.9]